MQYHTSSWIRTGLLGSGFLFGILSLGLVEAEAQNGWSVGLPTALWTDSDPAADTKDTDIKDADAEATDDSQESDESEAAEADAPESEFQSLMQMREEESEELATKIFEAVANTVKADATKQNALAKTLVQLLQTPEGFTLQGSVQNNGMSGMSPGGMPPMSGSVPGMPPSGIQPMSISSDGMSGPPGGYSDGSPRKDGESGGGSKVLKPIPLPVVYACVHGLFQLQCPEAIAAIPTLLNGSAKVEDDQMVTGITLFEMVRRFNTVDQKILLQCVTKPTTFRKASTQPTTNVGKSDPYMSGSSGPGMYGSPGMSGGKSAVAEPMSVQDLQTLSALLLLTFHPTEPIQTAVAQQLTSPTCSPQFRIPLLMILQMSPPTQLVSLKKIIAASDPDATTRATFTLLLAQSQIAGMPELLGLPATVTQFDGGGVSANTSGNDTKSGYPGGGYPGSPSPMPMSDMYSPGPGMSDGMSGGPSPGGYPGGYPGGPSNGGSGGVTGLNIPGTSLGKVDATAIQQMLASQDIAGNTNAAFAEIMQLDPSLMTDMMKLMNASLSNGGAMATFWSADSTKSAMKQIVDAKPSERGGPLVQLVTTPTVAARQAIWKYLQANESKGPGDFLAIGVGEKLMPDPSLLISVKNLKNRRKAVPLASSIAFANTGVAAGNKNGGYPGGVSGYPGGMSGGPGSTGPNPTAQAGANLSGSTSWAAFSDYLRHWMSQRFALEDIDPRYTRVAANRRPYDIPNDAEVIREYQCVLPSMIPDATQTQLGNDVKVDSTYVYFARLKCSEKGTNSRLSFYNAQLRKKVGKNGPQAYESFMGTGYWLDWVGTNAATNFPRSVDVYIRPAVNAFDQEKPLATLVPQTPNSPNTGYGSMPPSGYGPGSGGGPNSGAAGRTAEDPTMPGLLGNYLGSPLSVYPKAAPTTLIIDVLVVECRASAEPPKKVAPKTAAKSKNTEDTENAE